MKYLRTVAGLSFIAVTLLSAVLLSPRSPAEAAGSADIVISQLYAGGGRSVLENSSYQNDYVELFNRGAGPVDVSTWSLQYQATTQSTWAATNLSGVIQPGGYLLVAGALATPKLFPLPPSVSGADVSGSLQANPGRGKLALVTSRALLSCGSSANDCASNPSIRDFLGYGAAGDGQDGPNNYETAPAAEIDVNQVLLRLGDGCTDTDNNHADFVVSSPRPRNSRTAVRPCSPASITTPTSSPTATQTPFGGVSSTPLRTSTRTPGPSPSFTTTPLHGDTAITVGTSTSTPGPSPTSSAPPSPTVVVERYAVVLDGVPDVRSGPFAVQGAIYGAGSLISGGTVSDSARVLGRYMAVGWRYGPGFGESAATHVLSFPTGDLSVSGAVPSVIPVTGGSGAFAGARGEVRVSPLGGDGRTFSVQLSVSGGAGSRSVAPSTGAAPTATTPTAKPVGTTLLPALTPGDPRYLLQNSGSSEGWVESGALFTSIDLQEDGTIRPGSTRTGSFRSWVMPDASGGLRRMVSVQIGSQGELLASGSAPGSMPIIGGSGRYRDARGAVFVEARGETSLVTILLRSGAEAPRSSATATQIAATEAPSDS